jgi:hypothetical protein
MEGLLNRHILTGLLAAPWVRQRWAQMGDDDRFFAALQELVAYAYGESIRVKQRRLEKFPLGRRTASWTKCKACYRDTEDCSRGSPTSLHKEESLHDARTSTRLATT